MAFESLSTKLQQIVKKIKGETRINQAVLSQMTREIKLTLLEADVNYVVVKEFISNIETKALGSDVINSLTPGQQVVKIVKDELTDLLGSENAKLNLPISNTKPAVIMLVGLQGAGKTTLAGKLANKLRKEGKKPLLAACDVQRPAAIDQLETLANSLDVPFYANRNTKNVIQIAKEAIESARSKVCNVVILDTAGRLQIDTDLMKELEDLKAVANPDEILLVVDSMIGQEAANVSKEFNEKLDVTGIVLTKLDGDLRGGSALSIKKTTGKDIKLVSNGEKLSDLEDFYPDRMASRILGMGDVLSIIEKAEQAFDQEEAAQLQEKIKKQTYDLNDYLEQMRKIKKMGSISSILSMIPGLSNLSGMEIDQSQFTQIEAIIQSMTEKERRNYKIIDGSRRKRIAKGSGTTVEMVNKFLKSYQMFAKLTKEMKNPRNVNKIMKQLKMGNLGKF